MRETLQAMRLRLDPLVCACRMARQTAHLMVGLTDYDGYVAHIRKNHPDVEPMDRRAFFRDAQDRRYGGGDRAGVMRCC